jgi:hypothetical protein
MLKAVEIFCPRQIEHTRTEKVLTPTPHSNCSAKTGSSYSDFGHNQPNVPAVSAA